MTAIDNCSEASTADGTKCNTGKCAAGYAVDATDGLCYKCDATNHLLYECTSSSSGTIAAKNCASDDYYKGTDLKCYLKDSRCTYTAGDGATAAAATHNGDGICDNTSGCAAGSYYDTPNKKCADCPTGCTACSSATSCSTCDNSEKYYLSGVTANSCVKTSLKCKTWTNAEKCATCFNADTAVTGNYLTTAFACSACSAGCATCTSTACTACATTGGYA